MTKNGLISSPCSDAFTVLPFAQRALRKLEKIIDDEMTGVGAQRVMMPSMLSTHLLHKSGESKLIVERQ